MMEPTLEIRNLQKRYGGLKASDDLSLDLKKGEVHAVIGPNGAGKSTLVAQISGLVSPDQGSIVLKGQNITKWSAARRARCGIARTFQITSMFRDFSALDNVLLAYQCAHRGHAFRFFKPARQDKRALAQAHDHLHRVGLSALTNVKAAHLSGGQQRAMEIAMAIAADPDVLLLDEPMAGMGREDTARLVVLLSELRNDYAMLLIEHDMDVIFRLSDRISVLMAGQVIASGSPDEVRSSALVQEAYLGGAASHADA
jgi:branched-chain amino acid transport system ATP-binding protein